MTLYELALPGHTGVRVIGRHELEELGYAKVQELEDALELAALANPQLHVTLTIDPVTQNRIIRWEPR